LVESDPLGLVDFRDFDPNVVGDSGAGVLQENCGTFAHFHLIRDSLGGNLGHDQVEEGVPSFTPSLLVLIHKEEGRSSERESRGARNSDYGRIEATNEEGQRDQSNGYEENPQGPPDPILGSHSSLI
jgi:hypothetical protein